MVVAIQYRDKQTRAIRDEDAHKEIMILETDRKQNARHEEKCHGRYAFQLIKCWPKMNGLGSDS